MPIGLSITCKQKEDLKCLSIAYAIESTMNYKRYEKWGEKYARTNNRIRNTL